MSGERVEFEKPESILIAVGRWTGWVTIIDAEGVQHRFIFSADSGDTYNDGIYFATEEEHEGRPW